MNCWPSVAATVLCFMEATRIFDTEPRGRAVEGAYFT
jgi:hypothetical protein